MKQGQILNCLFCLGRTKETIWAAKKHMRQKSNDSQRKVRLKRTSQSRPHLSNLPIFCCPFLDSSACRKWTHHFDVLAHTSQHSTSLLSLISSLSKRKQTWLLRDSCSSGSSQGVGRRPLSLWNFCRTWTRHSWNSWLAELPLKLKNWLVLCKRRPPAQMNSYTAFNLHVCLIPC